jgi:hypothetical protein
MLPVSVWNPKPVAAAEQPLHFFYTSAALPHHPQVPAVNPLSAVLQPGATAQYHSISTPHLSGPPTADQLTVSIPSDLVPTTASTTSHGVKVGESKSLPASWFYAPNWLNSNPVIPAVNHRAEESPSLLE